MTHTPPPDLPDEARGKWSEIVGNLDADTLTDTAKAALRIIRANGGCGLAGKEIVTRLADQGTRRQLNRC